jgi:hypothetical protein
VLILVYLIGLHTRGRVRRICQRWRSGSGVGATISVWLSCLKLFVTLVARRIGDEFSDLCPAPGPSHRIRKSGLVAVIGIVDVRGAIVLAAMPPRLIGMEDLGRCASSQPPAQAAS